MTAFIKDQQKNFQEVIRDFKVEIKSLYSITKRLQADFVKNYEYTEQNTQAIELIKSTAVSVKCMRDFGAELDELNEEYGERFQDIEGAIREILRNADENDEDEGSEGDAERDEERESEGNDKAHEGELQVTDGDKGGGQEVSQQTGHAVGTEVPTIEKSVGAEISLKVQPGAAEHPSTDKSTNHGQRTHLSNTEHNTRGAINRSHTETTMKPTTTEHTKPVIPTLGKVLPRPVSTAETRPSAEQHIAPPGIIITVTVPPEEAVSEILKSNTVTLSTMVSEPEAEQPPKNHSPAEIPLGAEQQRTSPGRLGTPALAPTASQVVPSSQEGQDGSPLLGIPNDPAIPSLQKTPLALEHQPLAESSASKDSDNSEPGGPALALIGSAEPLPTNVPELAPAPKTAPKAMRGRAPRKRDLAALAQSTVDPNMVTEDIPRRTRAMTKSTAKPKVKEAIPKAPSSSLSPPP